MGFSMHIFIYMRCSQHLVHPWPYKVHYTSAVSVCQLGVIINAIEIPNFVYFSHTDMYEISPESLFHTENNDINYIMIAPKLTKLFIWNYNFANFQYIFKSDIPLESLIHLVFS